MLSSVKTSGMKRNLWSRMWRASWNRSLAFFRYFFDCLSWGKREGFMVITIPACTYSLLQRVNKFIKKLIVRDSCVPTRPNFFSSHKEIYCKRKKLGWLDTRLSHIPPHEYSKLVVFLNSGCTVVSFPGPIPQILSLPMYPCSSDRSIYSFIPGFWEWVCLNSVSIGRESSFCLQTFSYMKIYAVIVVL